MANRFFRLETVLATRSKSSNEISAVSFSEDGQFLGLLSEEKQLDPKTFQWHDYRKNYGDKLKIVAWPSLETVWQAPGDQILDFRIVGQNQVVFTSAFTDGEKWFAPFVGRYDLKLKKFSSRVLPSKIESQELKGLKPFLRISPDAKRIVHIDRTGKTEFFSAGSGQLLREMPLAMVRSTFQFSPDGRQFFQPSSEGVQILDVIEKPQS